MNANAQQIGDTFRTWTQQWSEAALKAVNAHEQFVTNMVNTMNRPPAMEQMPATARQAVEQTINFTTRQTLEGEKFVAGLMREGIENVREQMDARPEFGWPVDGEKARANADRFMKETAEVMKREMAFINDRAGEMAEFGRSMMECGFEAVRASATMNPAEGAEGRKARSAAKA